jgi:hypothetical protein
MVLSERGLDAYRRQTQADEKACEPVLSQAAYDEASGDTVRVVDFSTLSEPGKYYLIADGEMGIITLKE